MGFEIDMSAMPAGVMEEFRKGRVAREALTLAAAPRLQDMAARAVPLRPAAVDGLGGLAMVVTADAFHYWGRRLGYACWGDKQFREEFKRDNPRARVHSAATKIQVGWRAAVAYVPGEALKQKYPPKIQV